jgi:hypothetical protein
MPKARVTLLDLAIQNLDDKIAALEPAAEQLAALKLAKQQLLDEQRHHLDARRKRARTPTPVITAR